MAKKPTVRVQMADEPEDLPTPEEILKGNVQDLPPDLEQAGIDAIAALAATDEPPNASTPDGFTTYQARIRIVEAWKYPGSFANAPSFIDRNWAAYGDYDEDRKIEAGPALRLPARTPTGEKLARKGDYVVRQQVSLAPGLDPEIEIDVWPAEQFEKLFMPTTKPFRPFNPPSAALSPQEPAAVPTDEAPVGPLLPATSGNGDPHPPSGG